MTNMRPFTEQEKRDAAYILGVLSRAGFGPVLTRAAGADVRDKPSRFPRLDAYRRRKARLEVTS